MSMPTDSPQPPLPVRRLHNYLYCPRLFYYQWVENIFVENADTVEGAQVHRNVDAPSRIKDSIDELNLPEQARIRSLKLESETLGLVGVIDLIENVGDGPEVIDYKKGSAKRDANGDRCAKENDAMQIVAYALLLQEHGVMAERGWIYYAAERRRVPVSLTEDAFVACREKISEAKAIAASGKCPPPLKDDPRCMYCSAYPICLPNESSWWEKVREMTDPDPQLSFSAIPDVSEAIGGQLQSDEDFAESFRDKVVRAPRPARDDGEVLVVQTPGTQIGVRGGQFVVSKKKEVLSKIPSQQIRAVCLYGAVQLTAQAISICLELGIDVAWFSAAGRYLGGLQGLPTSGTDARRGQYRLFELPDTCLKLAREIIGAKIRNQRVMLMRNGEPPEHILKTMAGLRLATTQANNIDEILGIEGAAAALYFQQFPSMLKNEYIGAFDWNGRNRRPPRDPVNSLLSLGYSMLVKELTGICHVVGLDPFWGFMHQPRYGRPALALDLMEEFRPLIADSVAVSLINRREIGPEDFLNGANGTFLNDNGRKVFWESWFRRLDTEVRHPVFNYTMPYRRMLEVQVRQLWRFVRGEAVAYQAFYTR